MAQPRIDCVTMGMLQRQIVRNLKQGYPLRVLRKVRVPGARDLRLSLTIRPGRQPG